MKLKAFTLPELLVVLVIIGILVLLALPRLMPLITRTKATEAQLQLKHVHTLQKAYFYMHSRYSDELTAIGYDHERLVSEGGTANYLIEIHEVSLTGFRATATAVVDFDGDGQYNVWQIDQDNHLVELIPD